ncbi:MAG: hypothetical protein ACRDAQ_05900 [Cetobacterium sp.]
MMLKEREMAKGRISFDQFEGEIMNYIPKEFMRGEEDKKKVPKMKKENRVKSKGRVLNNKKYNDYMMDFDEN